MSRRAMSLSFEPLRVTTVTVILSAVAIATACRSADEEKEPVPSTASHAIKSAELEATMHELGRLDEVMLPQELDLHEEVHFQRSKIGVLARAIADSATEIPKVLEEVEMAAASRAEFLQLADEMGKRAIALGEAAPTLTIAQIADSVSTMRETCTECHTRFRVMPALR